MEPEAAAPGGELRDDLLYTADAIAAFLGLSRWQVYRIAENRELPLFYLRGQLAGRRSALLAAIEEKERPETPHPAVRRGKRRAA